MHFQTLVFGMTSGISLGPCPFLAEVEPVHAEAAGRISRSTGAFVVLMGQGGESVELIEPQGVEVNALPPNKGMGRSSATAEAAVVTSSYSCR